MTVNGKTLCSVIQSFPVLLILAQNGNKCLTTPFIYKPPSPTHPPEYYEAYDALIQSLFHHGCHDYTPYSYGRKYTEDYAIKPCNPTIGHYPLPGYSVHESNHGYSGYPVYPAHEHTPGRRRKRPVVSNDVSIHLGHSFIIICWSRSRRLDRWTRARPFFGQRISLTLAFVSITSTVRFFPQRDDRRFNVFGAVQNILENPRRTLQNVLNFGPDRNPNRPGINGQYYEQYGRPNYPNYPNEYYYRNIRYPNRDFNNGRDIVFEPTNNPFQNNYPNQGFNTRPNEEYTNVPNFGNNNHNSIPSTDSNGQNNFDININIPQFGSEQNNGISTNPPGIDENNVTPAPQFESNNGIPDLPVVPGAPGVPGVPGVENNNGIPTVPPPGVEINGSENNNGIPEVPPGAVVEENNVTPSPQFESGNVNNGIPDVPPPGLENNNSIPTSPQSGFTDRNLGNSGTETSLTTLAPLTPVPNTGSRNNLNFGTEGLFLETCQTPEGSEGSCVNVYQCEPYLKLLKDAQRTTAATQLLRKALCGFEGNNPKVCCPRPGIPTVPPTQDPVTQAPVTQATTSTTEAHSGRSLTNEDFVDAFPEPPVCGTSSAQFSKVVGGVNAKLGDFPWMALLGYLFRGGPSVDWKCGGSLITARHVLTAAHCIHGLDNLYLVRLGELDLEKEDDGAAPIDVLIKTKIEHENYSRNSLTNDIGVLVLQQDVTFTKLIHPICIPLAPELRSNSYVNYNPLIAGWGSVSYRGPSASHLQALQLPVVSNEYCARAYSAYKEQTIDERVLCAGYELGGRDSCQGDSGGPLMQPVWNSKNFTTSMYQIGVVSYGKQCAQAGFPGVYTRVTQFIPWIQEKVLGKRT
ncbi:Proclotting enzyme [Papilio xuthus]|uniref:Proclotting enzyme n=2 Tax=Papilio xuthus TaxID=66420 RepID=A0A194PXA8_PAPXU|nr:Proclotting enzyme [Papilio xuthus]